MIVLELTEEQLDTLNNCLTSHYSYLCNEYESKWAKQEFKLLDDLDTQIKECLK